MQLDEYRKDLDEEYRIVETATFERHLANSSWSEDVAGAPGLKKGDKLTKPITWRRSLKTNGSR